MTTTVQSPTFGLETCATPVSRSSQGEMIELTDGLTKTEYLRTVTNTTERKQSIHAAYGICKSTTAAGNLLTITTPSGSPYEYSFNYKSASMTREEEIVGPVYCATADYDVAGGVAIAVASDKLQYANALLWTREKVTIELEGYGKIPEVTPGGEFYLKPGVVCTVLLTSQTHASTGILNVTGMKIQSLSANDNDGEWNGWTATLVKYVKNAVANAGTSILKSSLTLFGAVAGEDILSDFYKITIATRLSEDGYAELTETVEEYDDGSATATIPTLRY